MAHRTRWDSSLTEVLCLVSMGPLPLVLQTVPSFLGFTLCVFWSAQLLLSKCFGVQSVFVTVPNSENHRTFSALHFTYIILISHMRKQNRGGLSTQGQPGTESRVLSLGAMPSSQCETCLHWGQVKAEKKKAVWGGLPTAFSYRVYVK